ncbi:MAG: DUF3048 domain-containing protein [Peptostreptococcaceae bacterium]
MRKKLIAFSLLLSLNLVACSTQTEEENISTSNQSESSTSTYSYYTGEEIPLESYNNNIPFMVMIENSVYARPQSGLSFADIVYETSAEGGIPRFMALFYSDMPETIGPVRSVRPYFIDLALENNLAFAHCGGSAEALASISNDSSIMSINEISNGSYFWRDTSRNAPHNLYTSSENIIKSINDKNFNYDAKRFSEFDNSYYENDSLATISNISINLNSSYNTSYTFKNGLYTKSMDDELALDALTNKPLTFSNVVIQKTNITLQNDNTHLNVALVGEGEGYVFSNGRYINVLWKKNSTDSKTTLYDYEGKIVPLSEGKTIWHIVDNNTNLTFN